MEFGSRMLGAVAELTLQGLLQRRQSIHAGRRAAVVRSFAAVIFGFSGVLLFRLCRVSRHTVSRSAATGALDDLDRRRFDAVVLEQAIQFSVNFGQPLMKIFLQPVKLAEVLLEADAALSADCP